ncbi:MAG: hypothetical protein M1834_008491 [Cirrosporium novae-zelandiae]|nr:MAG: hypothetical protein M1834_008491 [Cirrosporium novae-zelandiae]
MTLQPMNSAPRRMTVWDFNPSMSYFSNISTPTSLSVCPIPRSETDLFVNTANMVAQDNTVMAGYQSIEEPIMFTSPSIIGGVSQVSETKNAVVHISRHLPLKHENQSPVYSVPPQWETCWVPHTNGTSIYRETQFNTEVDILMKVIQSKIKPGRSAPQQTIMAPQTDVPFNPSIQDTQNFTTFTRFQNDRGQTKYHCTFSSCDRKFSQKTQLEIHMRAHTGEKPFVGSLLADNDSPNPET